MTISFFDKEYDNPVFPVIKIIYDRTFSLPVVLTIHQDVLLHLPEYPQAFTWW